MTRRNGGQQALLSKRRREEAGAVGRRVPSPVGVTMRKEYKTTRSETAEPATGAKTKRRSPRELMLDVLSALNWGGPVRIAGVSVHIYSVPDGGTWRDGVVRVTAIPANGRGIGDECAWPVMTDAEALAEAPELIEYFASRMGGASGRIAAARELLRMAPEGRGAD